MVTGGCSGIFGSWGWFCGWLVGFVVVGKFVGAGEEATVKMKATGPRRW